MRIVVAAGQELVGIEFDANIGPTFKVSGSLRNIPAAVGTIGVLNAIPAFTFASTDRHTLDSSAGALTQNMSVRANGEFEISVPGRRVGHLSRDSEAGTNTFFVQFDYGPLTGSRERQEYRQCHYHSQFGRY